MAHVAVAVTDLERSIGFYRELLGFSVERSVELPDGTRIAFMGAAGHGEIELMQYADLFPSTGEGRAGLIHIALQVDALDDMYAQLKGKGVAFQREPSQIRPGGPRVARLRDPDGVDIELIQPVV